MKIRLGVIGLGRIFNSIIEALKNNSDIEIVALASRDVNKAKHFAKKLSINFFFGNYEEMLTSDLIDAVYVALPNSLHFKYCFIALNNKKSVICEKPITLKSEDFAKLINLAKKNNLVVTEALMYVYNDPFKYLKEISQKNEIGNLKAINATFNYSSKKLDDNDIRFDPDLGGGVINDLLYYPISLSNLIFKSQPRDISIIQNIFNKVDRSVTVIMKYENNKESRVQASYNFSDRDHIEIIGTKGTIEMPNAFRYKPEPEIYIHKKDSKKITFSNQPHRYIRQFENFSNKIRSNVIDIRSYEDILRDIKTLEMIKNKIY